MANDTPKAGEYQVIHSVLYLQEEQHGRKVRYAYGDKVKLTEEQAIRFMPGPDVTRGNAVRPWSEVEKEDRIARKNAETEAEEEEAEAQAEANKENSKQTGAGVNPRQQPDRVAGQK